MRPSNPSSEKLIASLQYALAVFIFLLALLIRFGFAPVESGYPFLIFYPAMVVAFYYCGISAGIVFVLLSSLTAYYIFLPPYWSFTFNSEGGVAIAIYLFWFIRLSRG